MSPFSRGCDEARTRLTSSLCFRIVAVTCRRQPKAVSLAVQVCASRVCGEAAGAPDSNPSELQRRVSQLQQQLASAALETRSAQDAADALRVRAREQAAAHAEQLSHAQSKCVPMHTQRAGHYCSQSWCSGCACLLHTDKMCAGMKAGD